MKKLLIIAIALLMLVFVFGCAKQIEIFDLVVRAYPNSSVYSIEGTNRILVVPNDNSSMLIVTYRKSDPGGEVQTYDERERELIKCFYVVQIIPR